MNQHSRYYTISIKIHSTTLLSLTAIKKAMAMTKPNTINMSDQNSISFTSCTLLVVANDCKRKTKLKHLQSVADFEVVKIVARRPKIIKIGKISTEIGINFTKIGINFTEIGIDFTKIGINFTKIGGIGIARLCYKIP